jgi:hypothetical protein
MTTRLSSFNWTNFFKLGGPGFGSTGDQGRPRVTVETLAHDSVAAQAALLDKANRLVAQLNRFDCKIATMDAPVCRGR